MSRLARPLTLLAAASIVATLAVAAPAASKETNLTLVAYSTPKEAYTQIISAFQKTPAGQGVTFDTSYAASGSQARAVIAGLPADIVALSLEPDMTLLVQAGLVNKKWKSGTYHGMVTDSIVVFVLRDGNPKKIKTWDDLLKPGVDVITPNPFTSGGARWNVMAAYGAWRKQGNTHKKAIAKLERLFRNVSVQNSSAREGLQTFLSGKGDVFLAYENEAYFAKKSGQPVQYLPPKTTILIENPDAITTNTQHPAEAKAFLKFLYTPQAQRLFAGNGYRPVVKSVRREYTREFPTRLRIFKIADLGGWAKVQKQFFDPKNGIMAQIERKVGGTTS